MLPRAGAEAAAAATLAVRSSLATGAPGTNVLTAAMRLPAISRANCWPALPLNSLADASRSYRQATTTTDNLTCQLLTSLGHFMVLQICKMFKNDITSKKSFSQKKGH